MDIEGVGDVQMSIDTGSMGILLDQRLRRLVKGCADCPSFPKQLLSALHRQASASEAFLLGKSFVDGSTITASGTVPVLSVEKLVTCPSHDSKPKTLDRPSGSANDTRASEVQDSTGIQYMGVGFGHQDIDAEPFSMPFTNSLLNIDITSSGTNTSTTRKRTLSSIQSGWIISTKGVVLGLTEQNTQNVNWEATPAHGAV
jgi:hypothetical protein